MVQIKLRCFSATCLWKFSVIQVTIQSNSIWILGISQMDPHQIQEGRQIQLNGNSCCWFQTQRYPQAGIGPSEGKKSPATNRVMLSSAMICMLGKLKNMSTKGYINSREQTLDEPAVHLQTQRTLVLRRAMSRLWTGRPDGVNKELRKPSLAN